MMASSRPLTPLPAHGLVDSWHCPRYLAGPTGVHGAAGVVHNPKDHHLECRRLLVQHREGLDVSIAPVSGP